MSYPKWAPRRPDHPAVPLGMPSRPQGISCEPERKPTALSKFLSPVTALVTWHACHPMLCPGLVQDQVF